MILNKRLICIHSSCARARNAHTKCMYMCVCFVCVCVCVCVWMHVCVRVCDATASLYHFSVVQLRGLLYTRRSYVYKYRCDRFTYFTRCLAAFTSSWFALASHKDLLLIRIRTYTADAPHTTDYQIRTAWQIDQSSAESWWTTRT